MERTCGAKCGFLVCAAVLVIAFGILTLVGCGSNANPIVGKWQSARSSSLMEFKADGTFSYTNSKITELGLLEGKWYAYKNNPVDVNGEKWYIYTTDSYMGGNGAGTYSEDIGGEYKEGRVDFAVKGDLMYGAVGFTLAREQKFNEDAIRDYLSDIDDVTAAYLTFTKA